VNVSRDLGNGLISIPWTGGGVLQETTDLESAGTNWSDVPAPSNPYIFTPAPLTKRFFRLRP